MEDLIGMNIIYNSKNYGKVIDLAKNNNFILKIEYEDKTYMIPFVDAFILKVDVKNKNIICDDIRGLIL
jgi:ribosomal 30S subunit maturation factor RimM